MKGMSSETTKLIQCLHQFQNISGCDNACLPGLLGADGHQFCHMLQKM